MISKVLRLSNGALYDPRLGLPGTGGSTPAANIACGDSFSIQCAKSFNIALSTTPLSTAFTLYSFPTCGSLLAPTDDDVTQAGPLLITSMVMVITTEVVMSGGVNPSAFSITMGMQEGTWSTGTSGINLDQYKWVSTGALAGSFSSGVLDTARTGGLIQSVYMSPGGGTKGGSNNNSFARVADAGTATNAVFFSSPTTALAWGVTVSGTAASGTPSVAFEANFYISGQMMLPLINPLRLW